MLYDIDDVARRVGLSPVTVRNYLRPGWTDLVRGRDYILWTYRATRQRYRITDRGLERLALQQYHVLGWREQRQYEPEKRKDYGSPRLRLTGRRAQRVGYLRAVLFDAIWRYQETPCAQPGCPCVIHKLGVPQADVVQIIMKRDGYVDAFGKFHRFEEPRK